MFCCVTVIFTFTYNSSTSAQKSLSCFLCVCHLAMWLNHTMAHICVVLVSTALRNTLHFAARTAATHADYSGRRRRRARGREQHVRVISLDGCAAAWRCHQWRRVTRDRPPGGGQWRSVGIFELISIPILFIEHKWGLKNIKKLDSMERMLIALKMWRELEVRSYWQKQVQAISKTTSSTSL